MSRKCYYCSNPIDKSHGPSERYWMWNHTIIAPAGVCCECKKGFCRDHFGYRQDFDPEVSTFGQATWCIACIDDYDDSQENRYNQKVERAKKWENFLWPVGPLVAFCIRGSKPCYLGTRSRSD